MYLRPNRRFKDGKEHRYWSIVESKRCAGGKVVQRQVLYLGEINDSQQEAWCRVNRGVRRGRATTHPIGPFSRRSAAARSRRGPWRAGPPRGHATASAAAMGRVLARLPAL